MRPLSLMLTGLFVGMISLAAIFSPTSEQGLSVRSAEAASKVKVVVNCKSNPETARVTNNTNRRIKVKKVGSIYKPRSNEPFRVNKTLRRGKTITFQSGSSARSNVLTRQYIYNNDVGSKEGARVATSVGRFSDRCG